MRGVDQVSAVAPARLEGQLGRREGLARPGRGRPARRSALLVVARDHGRLRPSGEGLDQRALSRAGVLRLVHQQVRKALRDGLGERRPLVQQPGQLDHRVHLVHRAGGSQHRVVHLVELRELTLPGGRIPFGDGAARLLVGPAPEPLGRHPRGLQRVDPVDDAREQARRISADLMSAQGQLVDPVEQHGQPLCRAQGLEEGVDLGLGGVLAQDPGGRDRMRVDDELLVGSLDRLLGADPDPVGRGGRAREREGTAPLADQAAQAPGQCLGPPGPGGAQDQQSALPVGGHGLLLLGRAGLPSIVLLSHRFQANPRIRHSRRPSRWARGNHR